MSFNAGGIEGFLGLDVDPFARGMLRAEGIMSLFPAKVTNFLVNPMLGVVGVMGDVSNAMVGMATSGIKLAADMEQNAIAFEVMVGNAQLATKTLNELKDFANTTPFEFSEIVGAGKQLLAMGVPAQDLVKTLRMLGDVGSGLNQPLGEMSYLFGQIRSQGRAMTQDLNQFAGRGVPIYRELATVLGTTEVGVRQLAEQGKIGFAEINAAFQNMTGAGGQFHDMTLKQAESIKGLWSTLQDAWTDTQRQFGEAISRGEDSHNLLKELTDTLERLKPIAVDFGLALSNAFSLSLPTIEKTIKSASSLLDIISQRDKSPSGNSSYADSRSKMLGQIGTDAIGIQNAIELAKAYSASFNQANLNLKNDLGITGLQTAVKLIDPGLIDTIKTQISEATGKTDQWTQSMIKLMDLQARAKRGEVVDRAALDSAVKDVMELADLTDRLQRSERRLVSTYTSLPMKEHLKKQLTDAIELSFDADDIVNKNLESLRKYLAGKPALPGNGPKQSESDFFAENLSAEQKAIIEKRNSQAGEIEYKSAQTTAERIAELKYNAETLALIRGMTDSEARLAIFDRETKLMIEKIDDLDEAKAQRALRDQQRIDLSLRLERDAAREEQRIAADNQRKLDGIARQAFDDQQRLAEVAAQNFAAAIGRIADTSSVLDHRQASSLFDPTNDTKRNRRGIYQVQQEYNDLIRSAMRAGNRAEADRLRNEKGNVLADLRDATGDAVGGVVKNGSAMPRINVHIDKPMIDTKELAVVLTERFRSVAQEEIRRLYTAIQNATHAENIRERI